MDFIAELTVTETDLAQSKDLIYSGFGAGEANPSHFDEPTNSIYLRIHNNTGSWKGVHASHHTGITSGTSVFDEIGSYDPTGTTFRIEKSGDDVTLSIVGVTGASQTFSLSAIASVLAAGRTVTSSSGTALKELLLAISSSPRRSPRHRQIPKQRRIARRAVGRTTASGTRDSVSGSSRPGKTAGSLITDYKQEPPLV